MHLAIVSFVLMLLGFFIGDSVNYPWTGLGCGIAAALAVPVFLGDC